MPLVLLLANISSVLNPPPQDPHCVTTWQLVSPNFSSSCTCYWGNQHQLVSCSQYLFISQADGIQMHPYDRVSKSFRTGRLEWELQMIQLSATMCSCIAILWVSLVSFAAITLYITFQGVFIVVGIYFVRAQSGNFWIHSHIFTGDRQAENKGIDTYTEQHVHIQERYLSQFSCLAG
jgi:hypothetical protein